MRSKNCLHCGKPFTHKFACILKRLKYCGRVCQHAYRRHTPEKSIAAFWERCDKSGGPDACWPYMGARESNGYGYPTIGYRGKHALGHRLAYELVKGPIPAGMLIMHSCDNPPCCNPAHLSVGTKKDNRVDAIEKGRCPTSVKRKLTADDVLEIRALKGKIASPALSRRFGVDTNHIINIWNRKVWRGV